MCRSPIALLVFCLLVLLVATSAQAGVYLTLDTRHFSIHFPQGLEDYAFAVGEAAEWAHEVLAPEFGHQPSEKTHIAIVDESDLANGFADPVFYNRMGLIPTTLVGYGYRSGFSATGTDWLRLLVLHEYAHVLHLDLHTGRAALLRSIFGRIPGVTNPHMLQSYALLEGVAVWQESAKTHGGRGTTGFYDMFVSAIVDHGGFLTVDQSLGLYSLQGWQPGSPPYLYGYLFVDYLITNYGEDAFHRLLYVLAGDSISLDSGLSQVYSRSLSQLWDSMLLWLREGVEADRGVVRHDALEYLPTQGHVQWYPRFSPDGRYLAYLASGDIMPSLRLLDWQTGSDRQLVAGRFGESATFTWSDSHTLLFPKLNRDVFGDLRYDLYAYDVRTNRQTRLTWGERVYGVEMLADGRLVHFHHQAGTTVMGVSTTGSWSDVIWSEQDTFRWASAAAVPEGMVVSATNDIHQRNLYVYRQINDTFADRQQLTANHSSQGNPVASPDGRYVLFDSDHTGTFQIHAYDRTSGAFFQITQTRYGSFAPTVSPDGKHLVFMNYTPTGYHLVRMDYDPHLWAKTRLEWEESAAIEPEPRAEVTTVLSTYSPWTSMKPRFWVPLVESEPQLTTGFFTAGKDALEQHSYSLKLMYGWEAGTLDYQLEYQRRYRAPFQPRAALQLTGHTFRSSGRWEQRRVGDLSFSLGGGGSFSTWRTGVGLKAQGANDSGNWERRVMSRWFTQYSSTSGHDRTRQQRHLSLVLSRAVIGDSLLTARASWEEHWSLDDRGRLVVRTGSGYSQDPEGLTIGGLDSDFPLRGYDGFLGSRVSTLTVEYAYPVLRVQRGLGDIPIFLQEISVGPFVDVANLAYEERWYSVGFEVGADIALAYGAASLQPRIGVAYPLETRQPTWYVRTGVLSVRF